MIFNFSNFFSNKIEAVLHSNPHKKNINEIVKEFSNSKKIAIPEQIHSCIVQDIKKEGIYSDTDLPISTTLGACPTPCGSIANTLV